MSGNELLYLNGINGATGDYILPPMSCNDLNMFILCENRYNPQNFDDLKHKKDQAIPNCAPEFGIDPDNLRESGWGIIFADTVDPIVKKEALSDLINLRKQQAGELFKIYDYKKGESKSDFIKRHGAAPGPVTPQIMPYYLLIVGSPEDIPFEFQYQLDVQYAVGRIYFDTPQEYANYAASVEAAENGKVRLPRTVRYFGVANDNDIATNLSKSHLITPLYNKMKSKLTDWDIEAFLEQQASKKQLKLLIGGEQTPALLITASHGMVFPRDNPLQKLHQGALMCQEWPGPNKCNTEQLREYYFSGEDISNEKSLLGLIAMFFACYSAGTPAFDDFQQEHKRVIAPQPFLSSLPTKMLSHPSGGALAIMGHVDRAWSYSFQWPGVPPQPTVFESTLNSLLKGHRIGFAFEFFNQRYAELSTELIEEIGNIRKENRLPTSDELIGNWIGKNDGRNYVILGDPAVKLCVADSNTPEQHKMIEVRTISDPQPQAHPKPNSEPPAAYGIMDNIATPFKEIARKLADMLDKAMYNLSTLEVQTYTGSDIEKISYDPSTRKFGDGANLRAITRIGINGDVSNLISEQKVHAQNGQSKTEIDPQLLQIHNEMVTIAQNNRSEFIKSLSEVAGTLINMVR